MDAHDWDERYAAAPDLWGGQPNATVVEQVADRPAGTAVDLACGDGRHAAWLAGLGWTVHAIDFSGVAVDQARRRPVTRSGSVHAEVADATTWAPPGPVDLVLIAYLHLPDLAQLLARATGWLTPGGELLYVGHALDNIEHGVGGPSDPAVLPSVAQVASALDGLRVRRLQHVDRHTDAGTAVDLLAAAGRWV